MDPRPIQTQNHESTLTPNLNSSRDKDETEFDSMPSQSVLDRAIVPAMHVNTIKKTKQTAECATSTKQVSANNDIIHTVPTAQ